MLDVAIIGCGVIGAASAYELSHYRLQTAIFEAENDVADCTTKANSAILHAGYDPEPGTRMARLNVEGSALAKEICARLDVPYRQCGSLVLALSPEELPHLQKLYENGIANGVPGIRLLSAEETLAMEPNLAPNVVGALYAPSAAIVSPWDFALAMAEVAVRNGVELHRSCPVTHIEKTADGWALTTPDGIVETRYIINAAGISAQAVHDMAAPHKFTIQPTRGEYYLLDKSEGSRVHHVIFQCPNENGKGVLVAPTVHGNLLVGPDAVRVEGDNTACTAAGLAFVSAAARRSVPSIRFGESIRNFAGVRANVDTGDFVIGEAEGAPGFIDLAGMKSPGLSSAPAVAKEVTKILKAHGDLPAAKTDYRDGRTRVRFKECSPEEKARLIAEDPAYGRVVCRCETITEGEILNALREEIPATTIDGVKRRAGAGMGRAHSLPDGIVQQHGAAVGRKDRQGQSCFIGNESVHIRVVAGADDALPGVCGGDAADVGGVGLLTQHGPVFIQPQNCEEAAVVFPEGFRAVPLVGAEIQAVPRGGGYAALPGGKAVGDGIVFQHVGGQPDQIVFRVGVEHSVSFPARVCGVRRITTAPTAL